VGGRDTYVELIAFDVYLEELHRGDVLLSHHVC
jgi:hypothetical protein